MAKTLKDLRAERAELVEKWNSILFDQDGNVRDDISEDQEKQAGDYEKQVASLDKKIEQAEKAQQAKAADAKPVGTGDGAGPERLPAQPKKEWAFKGQGFARAAQTVALAQLSGRNVDDVAKERYGETAHPVAMYAKALSSGQISSGTNDDPAGGFLVEEDFRAELIELLRSASVVMGMQPRQFDMPNGNLTIPGFNSGASAAYSDENANITKTEPSFREITLAAKKLAAVVPISNDLIRYATVNSEEAIRDDLLAAIREKMDLELLRGDGTGQTPTGLLNLIGSSQKKDATDVSGTSDLTTKVDNVRSDLSSIEGILEDNDIPMERPGWIMAPRTRRFLADLVTDQGARAFPEISEGFLRGKPFRVTTNVPTNLGSSPANESEIYLADFSQVVVGQGMDMQLTASETAAYHDGSNVVSAFSRDQSVMRAITEHDINIRHPNAVAVLQKVKYGA